VRANQQGSHAYTLLRHSGVLISGLHVQASFRLRRFTPLRALPFKRAISNQSNPLRILGMKPVFAAVWSAPAYDYGIVKRDNVRHVLEIIDEVTSVFCLYYNQGRLMH
jgi:hypothetical protein